MFHLLSSRQSADMNHICDTMLELSPLCFLCVRTSAGYWLLTQAAEFTTFLIQPKTSALLTPTHGRIIPSAANKWAHPVCLQRYLHSLSLSLEIDARLVLR